MKPENYVYSPNNIHSEIRENNGREIYTAGPGVPTLGNMFTIADMGESINVYVRPYGSFDLVLVSKYDSAEEFISYCKREGKISEGGINHITGPNVFD